MSGRDETVSTLLAAAVIFIVVVGGWFVMPPLMQRLGAISPWLAFLVAALFVFALFGVFWLRARFKRSRRD